MAELTNANVGVVVVNWNSFALLERCLNALDVQSYPIHRIIVVDNGSNSRPSRLPTLKNYSIEYIWFEKNTGFAHANNAAIAKIEDCEWIALVNPDAFPERDWLKNLIRATIYQPRVASFVGPTLMADDPTRLDGIGDVYHVSGLPWRQGYGLKRELAPIERKNVFSACAAAALYRRAMLVEVGGFDEDFFCYCEDVDLGFRLQLLGLGALYVPDAIALHVGSATCGGKQSDLSLYYGHRNVVWTYVKNMPAPLFWLLLPLHIAMALLILLNYCALGKGAIIWRAKRDAIIGLPLMWRKRKQIQACRSAETSKIWSLLNKGLRRQVDGRETVKGHRAGVRSHG